ncbi:MAG: Spy/CpxP family protein refolding chaperone [Bryobacterales bacterium]|nr:Spy/CpxP family protein refolding chaperone [Bryobacterales bacterium]
MRNIVLLLILSSLAFLVPAAKADAPLKSALNLTIEQAREVDAIQETHRRQFASKRQERNAELRKLRRARLANYSKAMSEHQAVAERMLNELRQIRSSEDDAIRRLLTPEQMPKFDAYIKQRKQMVGSSRDAADL